MSELSRAALRLRDSCFSDHLDSTAGQERRRCLDTFDFTVHGQRPPVRHSMKSEHAHCRLHGDFGTCSGWATEPFPPDEYRICAHARKLFRLAIVVCWKLSGRPHPATRGIDR